MKRIGIGFVLSAVALASLLSLSLSGCKGREKYVNVDRKKFPDEVMYEAARAKDTDHDTKLSQAEIENATSILIEGAKDLKGLDVFTNLESITIRDGENMKYDFKHFTNLRSLSIEGTWSSNRIDLSSNTKLERIKITSKTLQELVLPKGAPLKEFTLSRSLLKGIDLSSYKGLQKVHIETNNNMTELDFLDFPELVDLTVSANKILYTLNVSNCPKLTTLDVNYNNLANLNISGCSNIEKLTCAWNKNITSLDLATFSKLTVLECDKNKIASLDLSHCPELTRLVCYENCLTSLDLSYTPKLKELSCTDNDLTELDVSCCPEITYLSCCRCSLTTLNFAGCDKITTLVCYDNKLTSLDITHCAGMRWLTCSGNKLTTLDISKCPKLVDLMKTADRDEKDEGCVRYEDGTQRFLNFDKDIEVIK